MTRARLALAEVPPVTTLKGVLQRQSAPRPLPKVALGSSSVYPARLEVAFESAARLGYDGVEVMVLGDPATQSAEEINKLVREYGVPVLSIHAPTLLVTQRVWGTAEPWEKIDRSIDLAFDTGSDTVVLHPPFRWQREYARGFADGVATREDARDAVLAVENMFPWRAGGAWMQVYLPGWNPVPQPFDNVTIDFSHAAIAHDDVLHMKSALGGRLRHIHLCDGTGSFKDEHLVPGRGGQPVAQFLQELGRDGFEGVIAAEVGTRRGDAGQRDRDLKETVEFARRHLSIGAESTVESEKS